MSKSAFRGLLGSVFLVAASTAVTLALAEWAVRLALPQDVGSIVNIYVQDDALQYKYQPRARARQKSPEFDVEIVTNSMGFRDDEHPPAKPPHTCRIMVVGDSFSVAHGLPVEDGYAAHLERDLNARPLTAERARWEVINASVSGYHLYHYMRSIELYARPLGVDLVLVGFYVNNDFGGHDGSSRRIVRDGYLGRYERGVRETEDVGPGARFRRAITPAREWLATHSHLYVLSVRSAFPLLARAGLVEGEYAVNFRRYARQPDARVEQWYRETGPLLAATAAATRAAAAALLVVVIPDRFQVYDALWSRAVESAGVPAAELAADTPNRRLEAMLAEQGLQALDLLPAFRSRQAEALYFERDGHWNAAGHALAAATIGEWLGARVTAGGTGLPCLAAGA